jgi:pimeloyl-ACP methyl ester carboxylesterase
MSSILVNRRNALCLFGAALATPTLQSVSAEDVKRTDAYFTTSDGLKLHYVLMGAGKSSVLLMHGYTGDAEGNWIRNGIAPALAAKHRVIAFDARGHGLSDKPHDPARYATDRFPQDALELMDHLKVPKAHIGGYSMGGNMLGLMMAMKPERFLSASFGGSGLPDPDPGRRSADEALDAKGADPAEAAASEHLRAASDRDSEALEDVRKGRDAAPTATHGVDLATIRFPIQVVAGEFDRPHLKSGRIQRECHGADIVILSGRSHLTTVSDPRYRDAMVRFMDGLGQI